MHRRSHWRGGAILPVALVSLLAGVQAAGADTSTTLYVSTSAKSTGDGTSCATAKYSTIAAAIADAPTGATVLVCAGTYPGQVVVSKSIVLLGQNASIIATHANNGIVVNTSTVTVRGFLVKGAIGEGILVSGAAGAPISHVAIVRNVVEGNDQGNPTGAPITNSSYAECNATPQPAPAPAIPGDCGEGIHLMGVEDSTVSGNLVVDNSGGILLTDEVGPTDNNSITGNATEFNVLDCGITLASHSPKGFVAGATAPTAGGLYDNSIEANTVIGNGTVGQGAGILLASPLPGGAVYNNTIDRNVISGNGLAGVTVHSHVPGQDLNGNVIDHNHFGVNNVIGDFDFSPHVDAVTTGIIVATSNDPIAIQISNNFITSNTYGIWQTGPVTVTGLSSNMFIGVSQPNVSG